MYNALVLPSGRLFPFLATVALVVCVTAFAAHVRAQTHGASAPLVHVSNEFAFTVHAPYDVVAPLFGPIGERAWGGADWNPQFIYPQPEKDVVGAVFTVAHGSRHAVWTIPTFDLAHKHVQYVNVLPETMVTLIDITFADGASGTTAVHVRYDRTALASDANEQVAALGVHDAHAGPKWLSDIDGCLKRR